MKVLLFVLGFPESDSPNQGVFNLNAARALSEYVDLEVLHLRMWKPGRPTFREVEEQEKFRHYVIAVPMLPVFGSRNLFSMLTLLDGFIVKQYGYRFLAERLKNADLIHSVGASFCGIVASAWTQQFQLHHVLQIIGADVNSELDLLTKYSGGRKWARSVHGVSANSRDLKQKFQRFFPDTPNMEVIYRGVNLDRFKPAEPQNQHSSFRFLFLGGLPKYPEVMFGRNRKGGITLMEAWKSVEINDCMRNCELIFAGTDSDCMLAQEWKNSLSFPDRVALRGKVHPDDIPDLLHSADIVLVPSLMEGLPNTAMEACACAKPVLGCRIGGVSEVVEDKVSGLLVTAADAEALSEALVFSAENPDTLKNYGAAARRRMEEYFDSRNFAPKLVKLYDRAMQQPV